MSRPIATKHSAQADCWSKAEDEAADLECRLAALLECQEADEPRAAALIVSELCRDDTDREWRNALVQIAEDTQFDDPSIRAALQERLLELATTLRCSAEPGIQSVVFSAIRTCASLLTPDRVNYLLPFLPPPAPIETRLVALQCVVNIFESRPADNTPSISPLADRVHELVIKFLDPDWLVAGEKAAIAQNAVHALAVLGDDRLSGCVAKINALNLRWLTRQVRRKLAASLAAWREANVDASNPALILLQESVNKLPD